MQFLKKIGHPFVVVIHDPDVQRSGKQFAAKIAVRLVLAAGGSVELANLIVKALS